MLDTLRRVDAAAVAHRWRQALPLSGPAPAVGLPDAETRRSPAAWRVSHLASRAGLFPFHFEHRHHLPLPEAWIPPGHAHLAEPPTWQDGILPERKTQSFRHDLLLASFHPHHRAKWGTHELCHGLVGFAWSPDATLFFHATAGRVAELLPVALWYGFDEAWLRRCPLHRGDGALFELHCDACEAAATHPDPDAPRAVEHVQRGLDLLVRELEAVHQTRKTGQLLPHRYATLNLCADGLAYARAHAQRLTSPAFHRYAERFLTPEVDVSPNLDHLIERVVEVTLALTQDTPLRSMAPTPAHGRARWVTQDLAWRVLTTQALLPDHASSLEPALDLLTEAIGPTHDPRQDPAPGLRRALDLLRELAREPDLPWAADLLEVGYELPGSPPASSSLSEGLATALPTTWDGIEQGLPELVQAFLSQDVPRREALALRFARWLRDHHPGPLGDLAWWEAHAGHVPPFQPSLRGPARGPDLRVTPGWRVITAQHDVLDLAARVAEGSLGFRGATLVVHDGPSPRSEPHALLLGRDPEDGEPIVLDVDPHTAALLQALPDKGGPLDAIPTDERQALLDHGALQPVAWEEHDPDHAHTGGHR